MNRYTVIGRYYGEQNEVLHIEANTPEEADARARLFLASLYQDMFCERCPDTHVDYVFPGFIHPVTGILGVDVYTIPADMKIEHGPLPNRN